MAQGVWGAQPLWSWEEPPAHSVPVGSGWGRAHTHGDVSWFHFPTMGRDNRRVLWVV